MGLLSSGFGDGSFEPTASAPAPPTQAPAPRGGGLLSGASRFLFGDEPLNASFGGFARNLGGNTADIIKGTALMAAAPLLASYYATLFPKRTYDYIASGAPVELAKEAGRGVLESYGEYRHPGRKLYEHPLDVGLDVATLLSLGAAGLTRAGKAATVASQAAERTAGLSRTADEFARTGLAASGAGGPAGLLSLPALTEADEAASAARLAGRQAAIGSTRAGRLAAAGKALTPEALVLENLVPEKLGGRAIQNWGERITGLGDTLNSNILREIGATIGEFGEGSAQKRITDKFMAGRTGEYYRQREHGFFEESGDVAEQLKALNPQESEAAFRLLEGVNQGPIPAGLNAAKIDAAVTAMRQEIPRGTQFRMNKGKLGAVTADKIRYEPIVRERMGWTRDQFDEANTLQIRDAIARQFGSDTPEFIGPVTQGVTERGIQRAFPKGEPIYVPEVNPERVRAIDHLVPSPRIVRLKTRTGAGDYTLNLADAHYAYNRLNAQIAATDDIMAFALQHARPWNSNEPLLPGHMAFTPGGVMGFQRLQKHTLGRVIKAHDEGRLAEEIENILANSFMDSQEAREVGALVNSNRQLALQIPEAIGKTIKSYFTAPSTWENWFRIWYDRPIQVFKAVMLPFMPRWMVNNSMTNAMFATIFGTSPRNIAKVGRLAAEEAGSAFSKRPLSAESKRVARLVPGQIAEGGGFAGTIGTGQHLGNQANTRIGRLITSIQENRLTRIANGVTDSLYRFNQALENIWRRSAYLTAAEKQVLKDPAAKERLLQAKGHMSAAEAMDREIQNLRQHPDIVDNLVNSVETFFGNYNALTPSERAIWRRILPFFSWQRHITRLATTFPLKHPIRTRLISYAQEAAAKKMDEKHAEVGGVPKFMEGSIPIGTDSNGQTIFLNTAGFNPLAAVDPRQGAFGIETGMVNPLAQMAYEAMTGRAMFTQRPFTHPQVVEFNGKFYSKNPNTGAVEEISGPPRPVPFNIPAGEPGIGPAAYLETKVPQLGLIEQAVHPYAQYTSGSLMNPQPIMKEGAPAYPRESADAFLRFLGISLSRQNTEGGERAQSGLDRAAAELAKRESGGFKTAKTTRGRKRTRRGRSSGRNITL